MKIYIKILLVPMLLFDCIGVDILDDELIDKIIDIEQNSGSLLIGDQFQFMAKYYNEYGIETDVSLIWKSSSESVAIINSDGLLSCIGSGQTFISASFDNAISELILITVVDNAIDIARIIISPSGNSNLRIGESIQLFAAAFNINDNEILGKDFEWSTSDESIATITVEGLVTGIQEGTVNITATSDGIVSEVLELTIGNFIKLATFVGINGYIAEGTATLILDENDQLILEFSSDFKTSYALGTFVYLSNATSGTETRSNGLEIQKITEDGAKSFNISIIDPNLSIDSYRYVIILCKPVGITFGIGDFEN